MLASKSYFPSTGVIDRPSRCCLILQYTSYSRITKKRCNCFNVLLFVLCQFIPPTKDEWVFLAIHYKVSVCCFPHLYRRFAVRLSCTLNVQPTAFPFALPVPAIQSPAWFILSAFTAFATSRDVLAGLSLLSILGRRSWIVSLAPSYMLFFCVSIFQRTSFCGRKRCDPQELSEARA